MKLTKSLITIFLLFITVKAIAQCPSGATHHVGGDVSSSNFSSGVHCLEGTVTAANSLTIGANAKVIVMPNSKLEIAGYFTLNGTFEIHGIVELNGGISPTSGSLIDLKSNSYFSITDAVTNADGSIYMDDYSVVEFCNNFYRQISGNPMILYT